MTGKHISIWFFIGLLLAIYGVLIFGEGVYQYLTPPDKPVVLQELHSGIWWGALLLVIGVFYVIHFRPSRAGK
jgi:hypothetical protein